MLQQLTTPVQCDLHIHVCRHIFALVSNIINLSNRVIKQDSDDKTDNFTINS